MLSFWNLTQLETEEFSIRIKVEAIAMINILDYWFYAAVISKLCLFLTDLIILSSLNGTEDSSLCIYQSEVLRDWHFQSYICFRYVRKMKDWKKKGNTKHLWNVYIYQINIFNTKRYRKQYIYLPLVMVSGCTKLWIHGAHSHCAHFQWKASRRASFNSVFIPENGCRA